MTMTEKLLALPDAEPESRTVRLPRLDLEVTLREISYDKLMQCRKERDSTLHYLLASVTEPSLKDPAWYRDKMGCPTPVDAVKRLLRPGEIEALAKAADRLNGYGFGAVVSVEEEQRDLEDQALGRALEELEKN